IERETNYSDEHRESIRKRVSYDPGNFYFLTITKLWDLRKNTRALVHAFQRQRSAMPKARLIIKAGPEDVVEQSPQDGLIVLHENLTETQINALYALADVYVSPHHSEGWGLTLSDAMLFEKPTIATGYSGNCEFMNADNSWLLDFMVDYIKPEDCFYLFDSSMKWAYPSVEDLEQKLLSLYENRQTPEIHRRVQTPRTISRNSIVMPSVQSWKDGLWISPTRTGFLTRSQGGRTLCWASPLAPGNTTAVWRNVQRARWKKKPASKPSFWEMSISPPPVFPLPNTSRCA